MKHHHTAGGLSIARVRRLIGTAGKARILVIGDILLDRFIWGRVSRISPEAPVPIVEFDHESSMPGGAANVARNLTALGASAELLGVVGRDSAATEVKDLLTENRVGTSGVLSVAGRSTSVKTRIIAHQQQVVRVDQESRDDLDAPDTRRLLDVIKSQISETDGIIVGDYGKGTITQRLLDELTRLCRARGVWLSLDPKPVHQLDLRGLSLITPNRKEAFELAGVHDGSGGGAPLKDVALLHVAEKLLNELSPALLLITLGEQGMLLCRKGQKPFHIPTIAQAVFDVSGAGDTVIASFTLSVIAGASPEEAAVFSNHAAGVVVGKFGTATVSAQELLASFNQANGTAR